MCAKRRRALMLPTYSIVYQRLSARRFARCETRPLHTFNGMGLPRHCHDTHRNYQYFSGEGAFGERRCGPRRRPLSHVEQATGSAGRTHIECTQPQVASGSSGRSPPNVSRMSSETRLRSCRAGGPVDTGIASTCQHSTAGPAVMERVSMSPMSHRRARRLGWGDGWVQR